MNTPIDIDTESLSSRLRGQLIEPDDADYEQTRQVTNAAIDRHPRLIVKTADTADVIACVDFAREAKLPLSVRGGGHGVVGFGTNDGGLVIDLSRMRGMRVDPKAKTVVAEGGCTWRDLDHATHAFGLATPGGVVSTTGVAGLTLGGGIGHLSRKCGLSCDNLLAADVVLADGTFVVASETENSDLLWALRGGGGNFGAVTAFHFRLHDVGLVYAGPLLWHLDRAGDVMRFCRELLPGATEDLNLILAFMVVPPAELFPSDLHGQNVFGAVVCFAGDLEEAETAVRPLRELGPPIFDGLGEVPFPMLQMAFDAVAPPGLYNYWKADFATDLTDELIEVHLEYGPLVPNIYSGAHIFSTSGSVQRIPADATAWSYRDARFSQVVFALDSNPAKMPQHVDWVRDYWSALHPHSAGGAYVNFLMEEGDERVAASYRGNYARLAALKARYDSDNLFRMNQNIKPAHWPKARVS